MRPNDAGLICQLAFLVQNALALKCYSCATPNMQSNFLTKQRGPQNRIAAPRTFDGNCNGDTWIIKDRSSEDCDGYCFKWQQIVNNSGSNSYMTFRGCYSNLYNMMDPNTFKPPNHSFCTMSNAPLACLSDSSVIEFACWCQGDYCNRSLPLKTLSIILIAFVIWLQN